MQMMRQMKWLAGLLFAAALVACGGGGGSSGTTTTGGSTPSTTTTSTATASVTDFALFTDKTTLNNSGTDSARLTVLAVDASRNVVAGARVSVTADQNGVFIPSGTQTDQSGSFTGTLQIGSDKSDRDITLAVTVNSITKRTAVRVSGSRLTLNATPPTPSPGQTVTLTARLVDSAAAGIAGVPIRLGGVAAIQDRTITTDLTGTATTTFAAPTAQGSYTLTAAGNGTTAPTYQLNVFTTAVPAAEIPAGVSPSLSAAPNVLAVNSPGSTTNRSTLRFLFLDGSNRPISNVRVRFEDRTQGLPAVGASFSTGSQTLITDSSGVVTTQYISGQNSSPTNGVTIRACYSATDFASATDCPASVSASLTVAGQALAVSIGDDNLLQVASGTYIKQFVVTVADSAGRAVANAPVDISVDLTHYGKGQFVFPYRDATGTATFALNVVPSDLTASYPSAVTIPSGTSERVWCANEDTNRNGNVDPGENVNGSVDSNGQPTLEPRKSDLLINYASATVTSTDTNGVLLIKVQYSQRFATWLAYRVRVTANVAGSQGMAEREFVTSFVDGDEVNGSFLNPPYGINSCVTAN